MKNTKIVFLMLLSLFMSAYSYKVNKNNIWGNGIIDMKKIDSKIFIFGPGSSFIQSYQNAVISYYDGNSWVRVDSTTTDGDPVYIYYHSQINLDSGKNIWLSGKRMYRMEANEKWKPFFIDDSLKEFRTYMNFCVDKINNLWITTKIQDNQTNKESSELLLFDGKVFKTILNISDNIWSFSKGTFSGNSIACAPNGDVFVYRFYMKEDMDLDSLMRDILVFHPDGTKFAFALRTSLPEVVDSRIQKQISDMFVDGNKLWVSTSLTDIYLHVPELKYFQCCSGLSLYDGSNWKVFDKSNNMRVVNYIYEPYFYPDTLFAYTPIKTIRKLTDDTYYLLGDSKQFIMKNNYQLIENPWNSISTDIEVFTTQYSINNQDYSRFAFLDSSNSLNPPRFGNVELLNGDLWIMTWSGMIRFKKDLILKISEESSLELEPIYPALCENSLYIRQDYIQKQYQIYDILGKLLLEGITANEINLREIPKGFYIIRIFDNNIQKTFKFIKN